VETVVDSPNPVCPHLRTTREVTPRTVRNASSAGAAGSTSGSAAAAVTSAAATARRTGTPPDTSRRPVTRWSRVWSRASGGFTATSTTWFFRS